jgi:hypothetical protein
VGRQRNDRLGRQNFRQHYEHRRKILRTIWSHTNTNCKLYFDTYDNGYTDNDACDNTDPYRHDHTQCKPDGNTDWDTNSHGYSYTNAEHNTPSYSHTKVSPESATTSNSSTSHHTGPTATFATTYCSTTAHSATAYHTGAASTVAATYSTPTGLGVL